MKVYNFNFEEELIAKVDNVIKKSNNKFRHRTHFVILAMQDMIKREGDGKDGKEGVLGKPKR